VVGTRGFWLAVTSVCLTLGCSDSTAPGSRVEVTLTPETVRRSFPDSALMRVSVRNGTAVAIRLAFETGIVQVETTPGVWQRVTGGDGYYNITGKSDANDIEPSTQRLLVDGFALGFFVSDIRSMPIGRYRIAIKYAVLNASRSQPAASSYVETYSNAMVIAP
jgi:hypothetical protein